MNMDRQGESDATNIYFLLQVIYLFRGKDKPMDNLVIDTVKNFAKLYPDYTEITAQIIERLEAGEAFKALKITHDLLAQYERNTLPKASLPPEIAALQAPSETVAVS